MVQFEKEYQKFVKNIRKKGIQAYKIGLEFYEKMAKYIEKIYNKAIPVIEEVIVVLVSFLRKQILAIKDGLEDFGDSHPLTAQVIQLTSIYLFALVDLIYTILNSILMLGFRPDIIKNLLPGIQVILESEMLAFWSSPEKVFLLSYIAIELMVVRSIFKFSKLVKYHILLVFALLMLQGLVLSCLDFLFNREIVANVGKWTLDGGAAFATNKPFALFVIFLTFICFFVLYTYLYVSALKGKFVSLKRWEWISDSVSFWLKIYTPTMKFGKNSEDLFGSKSSESPNDNNEPKDGNTENSEEDDEEDE